MDSDTSDSSVSVSYSDPDSDQIRNNQETLQSVFSNDNTLSELLIGSYQDPYSFDGSFTSIVAYEYSQLGAAIGINTHITKLTIDPNQRELDSLKKSDFLVGLKRNSSIRKLEIEMCDIGCQAIASILACPNCNLRSLGLFCMRPKIDDEGATYLVNGLTNNTKLQELVLLGNSIGNIGCVYIASLLGNPNCNLQKLGLYENNISDQGAITLANGLTNNIKLQELDLASNPINNIDNAVVEAFSRVLCNTSSVSSTFLSNHALKELDLSATTIRNLNRNMAWLQLEYLRKLNGSNNKSHGTDKSHVAIKKILKFHPSIDMKQLFEFGTDDESLKALPYVVDWFEKARVAVADEEDLIDGYTISHRKLTAIYQFARFMPLLFIPSSVPTLIHRNMRDQLDADMNKLKIENGVLRQQIEKLEKEIAMKDAKISSMTTKDKKKLDDELIANSSLERNTEEQRSLRWREIVRRRMRMSWPGRRGVRG